MVVQGHIGKFLTGGTEVGHVVVGGGDEVHAALVQNLGVVGGGQEGELLNGGEPGIGQAAFQIGQGQIVLFKVFLRIGEGVGIVLLDVILDGAVL